MMYARRYNDIHLLTPANFVLISKISETFRKKSVWDWATKSLQEQLNSYWFLDKPNLDHKQKVFRLTNSNWILRLDNYNNL